MEVLTPVIVVLSGDDRRTPIKLIIDCVDEETDPDRQRPQPCSENF
ncbi:hypothetical protein ACIBI9_62095 [Nonomuraea sp. NPDC050451]